MKVNSAFDSTSPNKLFLSARRNQCSEVEDDANNVRVKGTESKEAIEASNAKETESERLKEGVLAFTLVA